MKRTRFLIGGVLGMVAQYACAATLDVQQPQAMVSKTMQLESHALTDKKQLKFDEVAHGFGCNGKGLSPQLTWKNVPPNAKSLVVTMYDPDAPTGSGFWHWNIYNLPVTIHHLEQGASGHLPAHAVELRNDAGTQGYFGACPPIGDQPHRYIITLYALNTTLDLPEGVSPAVLGFSLNGQVLEKTQIIGFYGR